MAGPPPTTDEPADSPYDDPDGLGAPVEVPPRSLRARIRAKPGIREAYRVAVFVTGLAFIVLGLGLVVLPGPLTIPPILIGLWIWSTEFRFAQRFFDAFKEKGHEAWAHAKAHPVSSAIVTVGGLVGAAAVVWAVGYFDLVQKARDAVGV